MYIHVVYIQTSPHILYTYIFVYIIIYSYTYTQKFYGLMAAEFLVICKGSTLNQPTFVRKVPSLRICSVFMLWQLKSLWMTTLTFSQAIQTYYRNNVYIQNCKMP